MQLKDHFKKAVQKDVELQKTIAKVLGLKPGTVYFACIRNMARPTILTQYAALQEISKAYKTKIDDLIEKTK